MKYCSSCGIKLQEGNSFCPKCGAQVQQQPAEQPQQTQQAPIPQPQQAVQPVYQKKSYGKIIGIVITLVIVLILLLVIFIVFTGDNDSNGGTIDSRLIGEWEAPETAAYTIIFKTNGSVYSRYDSGLIYYVGYVKGEQICSDIPGYPTVCQRFELLDDYTLILYSEEGNPIHTFNKMAEYG